MKESDTKSFYALVWNTALSSKEELIIQGEEIHRDTIIPDDPRMLYGTNNNDVARITKVKEWKEIKYDTLTTKQSVRFWKEIDEYVLARDVRIIVWAGESELMLPSKEYRIVAPDLFKHIVETAPVSSASKSSTNLRVVDSRDNGEKWGRYKDPSMNIDNTILDSIDFNETIDNYEDNFINTKRDNLIYAGNNKISYVQKVINNTLSGFSEGKGSTLQRA